MSDSKQTNSASEEQPRNTGFNFPCCKPEEMFGMMEKFCSGKESSFGCGSMMQQTCCGPRKEQDK